jgi:hypothetical protein
MKLVRKLLRPRASFIRESQLYALSITRLGRKSEIFYSTSYFSGIQFSNSASLFQNHLRHFRNFAHIYGLTLRFATVHEDRFDDGGIGVYSNRIYNFRILFLQQRVQFRLKIHITRRCRGEAGRKILQGKCKL